MVFDHDEFNGDNILKHILLLFMLSLSVFVTASNSPFCWIRKLLNPFPLFKWPTSLEIYQQKKTLRILEVVDQQDFSNSSLLES